MENEDILLVRLRDEWTKRKSKRCGHTVPCPLRISRIRSRLAAPIKIYPNLALCQFPLSIKTFCQIQPRILFHLR
jgi:hypothetical protein